MNKTLLAIRISACLAMLASGLILLVSAFYFLTSFIMHDVFIRKMLDMAIVETSTFYYLILRHWMAYLPVFIGALFTLKLKNWGRLLLIAMNVVSFAYTLWVRSQFIAHGYTVSFSNTFICSLVWYLWFIIFFSLPKVKEQFGRFS